MGCTLEPGPLARLGAILAGREARDAARAAGGLDVAWVVGAATSAAVFRDVVNVGLATDPIARAVFALRLPEGVPGADRARAQAAEALLSHLATLPLGKALWQERHPDASTCFGDPVTQLGPQELRERVVAGEGVLLDAYSPGWLGAFTSEVAGADVLDDEAHEELVVETPPSARRAADAWFAEFPADGTTRASPTPEPSSDAVSEGTRPER